MPTAVTPTSTMSGIKRKSAPVKNVHVEKIKKAKVELGSTKNRGRAVPVDAVERSGDSESISEFSDSEGGAPLLIRSEEEGQSSKEAHAKQKQLAQERKAAKPLADPLARTKKIWERLRRKSHVPHDERKELVAELFHIITGQIKEFVLKHDSVRVVQTAIKYANLEQKRMIAKELAGTYRQLAESRYAKFLIGKLLVQGDNEIRDLIVPEFYGHVRRLIKHPEASWILDDVYRGVASKQQKAIILREWYGAEFSLFQKDGSEKVSGELCDILAADSGKRAPIMRSLQELINQLIQKKMTGFTLLHDAMLQYFLNAKPGTEEITDFIELLKGDEEGDLMKNLAFTRSGSRVVCLALAYGTAKDRKYILKIYKDTLQMMATDTNAHIVILTAFEVIDDTVLASKSIFPEILSKDADKQVENIVLSANDPHARIILLYLFLGRSKSLFPASHSTDLEILAEIDIVRTTTSKKDPEIRRGELMKALSPYLLKAIATGAADLVATSFGCQFVTEVLFGAEGDKAGALAAVASTAAGDPTFVQSQDPVQDVALEGASTASHIGAVPYGGKMFKTLIAGGRFDSKTRKIVPVIPALDFANVLYPHIRDHVVEWATGPSSFVVLALVESSNFAKKGEVMEILRGNKNRLQKAAKEETATQKAKREATGELSKGKNNTRQGKKSMTVEEHDIGNRGSALLLGLL
ncbi:Pumilio domain family member [Hyphodiscus hymeniophilus]|uniref:Pumilio domain family member n=1 Tax=Hyphodiscus hymeniophilus TaxID=353542 RepID=A0A9P7AYA5_9HELO|nr:Pumilio domain family member [Hyphodiscus hymeniophilus]